MRFPIRMSTSRVGMGERRELGDLRQGGEQTGGGRVRIELSEEEKSVLLECRKNSIARGIIFGVSSVFILRQFVRTGRVPAHVQHWSNVYYSSVGAVSFLLGSASYKQRCIDKLMSLEHSVLADQLKQHQSQLSGWSEEEVSTGSSPFPGTTKPLPPSSSSSSSPSILTSPTYSEEETVASDKHFSSAAVDEEQLSGSQPDAFGSESATREDIHPHSPPLATRTRGKTFDEIRDENRRRQLQQFQRQGSPTGRKVPLLPTDAAPPVRVRRNKYGDIVSDD